MHLHGFNEGGLLRRDGEFADPVLEEAYRQKYAPQDRLFGRVVILVAVATVSALGLMDRSHIESDSDLAWVRVVRVGFAVASGVALLLLRGRPSPTRFAHVLGGWYLCTVVVHLVAGCVWPPGHSELRLSVSITVLTTYLVLPLPIRYQLVGGALHTLTALALTFWLNPPAIRSEIVGELSWLGLINVLGVFMSYRLNSRQRRLFAAVRRQTELTTNLSRALAEVKTLRGLIRVCAWCRKVDSEGVWQQLEAYVKDHSHAEFTHGICPTCLETTSRQLNDTVA